MSTMDVRKVWLYRLYLGLEFAFLLQAALVVDEAIYAALALPLLIQLLCQAPLCSLHFLWAMRYTSVLHSVEV